MNKGQLLPLVEEWEREYNRVEESLREKFGNQFSNEIVNGSNKEHVCKFCGKKFDKAQALGGHTSKMHSTKPKSSIEKSFLKKRQEPKRSKLTK